MGTVSFVWRLETGDRIVSGSAGAGALSHKSCRPSLQVEDEASASI